MTLSLALLLCPAQLAGAQDSAQSQALNSGQHDTQAKAVQESAIFDSKTTGHYLQATEQLEIDEGAYSPSLGEQLLSLGQRHHTDENYPAAISALKRSTFLSRVNNGLSNPMQIPIVKSLIDAHIGAGQYIKADERQNYLYRIQTINYQDDPQRSIQALLNHAEWQRQAYLLNLGNNSARHLLMMNNAYQQAVQTISADGGELSKDLAVPLEGLLSAQYLLSVYDGERPEKFQISSQTESSGMSDPVARSLEFLHINAFRRGVAILNTLHTLHANDEQASPLASVEHAVALGDWNLWYNKRTTAIKQYKEAYQMLLGLEGAEQHIQRLFSVPVRLPTIKTAESELLRRKKHKKDDSGYFQVSYNVSKSGKLFKLKIIEAQPEGKSRRRSKIIRELKSSRFRPRIDNGEVATTENIVEKYAY